MDKFEYVSWEFVDKEVEKIAQAIRKDHDSKELDGIYAIPRGGLCVGVLLSHKLDLPLTLHATPNSIIVDDIADTGNTLANLSTNGRVIVTLYYHQQSRVKPDYWAVKKTDRWIIFPWEKKLGVSSFEAEQEAKSVK